MEKTSLRGMGLAATNAFMAIFFLLFAYAHAMSYMEQPRLSLLLIIVTETIIAVLLMVRRDPDETRHTWQTWLSTSGGTLLPLLLRPISAGEDMLIGQVLQVSGSVVQFAALAALNRSFGLLPAHRGIKSNGLYRFVRHPLYTAYLISLSGYLISNLSLYNIVILTVGTGFMLMRILSEEELLRQYQPYVTYSDRTRWRLVPYVW